MCGFAGAMYLGDASRKADMREAVRAMTETLRLRGPDDSGLWADMDEGVALGHRRLSVIELSEQGHQPMVSPSGRFVAAYNGEIYNHLTIREELTRSGHVIAWRGQSDTETLLAAISAWGLEAALRRFVGMFAFALWDKSERTLYLVRDRLGEKPLYYAALPNVLIFGSELKALRRHPEWMGGLSPGSASLYFRLGYVPAPNSIYEGVYKLPAGTVLKVPNAARQIPSPKQYWSVREAYIRGVASPLDMPEGEAITALDGLLQDAVAGQMVADVPLGAFLSGGIDSSSVVALMQAQSSKRVRTFTIGFKEASYNEAAQAADVARHLGTEHTELYVTPDDAIQIVPTLPSVFDEPFADPSQIPTALVSSLARRHVTVSLSGDGGDELFGGYNRYFWGRDIWQTISWLPKNVRVALAKCFSSISPTAWDSVLGAQWLPQSLRLPQAGDKLHKLAAILPAKNNKELYSGLVSLWQQPACIVPSSIEPGTLLTENAWPAGVSEFETGMMLVDMMTYLPDDILVKLDRAAMSVSLESRVPFLDHRVVEFAWRIPLSMKIKRHRGKWILREVLARYLPKRLFERPKMGFGVPIGHWLRTNLRPWAEDLLDRIRVAHDGLVSWPAVEQAWQEHLGGQRNHQYRLWTVLMFQAWLDAERSGSPHG
jgi:asparagine synthase (glutamine-hydrolysing)